MKSPRTSHLNSSQGFTLVEILIVIAIISILAGVVLIAINPVRQFAQARNSQREGNINTILNAIGQYAADSKGSLPSAITTSSTDALSLCTALVPVYLSSLPTDPKSAYGGAPLKSTNCSSTDETNYKIMQDSSTGRVTVSAPSAELGKTIEVTR